MTDRVHVELDRDELLTVYAALLGLSVRLELGGRPHSAVTAVRVTIEPPAEMAMRAMDLAARARALLANFEAADKL